MRVNSVLLRRFPFLALLLGVGVAIFFPARAHADEPRIVVVFGDSITEGNALPKSDRSLSWLHRVQTLSGGRLRMVNEGKGGRPTDSEKEFAAMLERHPKMDLLVIALGTNDSRDVSAQCVPKAIAHLNAMIELAHGKFGSSLPVLLVGPPNLRKDALGPSKPIAAQREAKLKELGEAFALLAQEKKASFVSFYGLIPEASLAADGVHPDAAGNEPLALAILPKLLP